MKTNEVVLYSNEEKVCSGRDLERGNLEARNFALYLITGFIRGNKLRTTFTVSHFLLKAPKMKEELRIENFNLIEFFSPTYCSYDDYLPRYFIQSTPQKIEVILKKNKLYLRFYNIEIHHWVSEENIPKGYLNVYDKNKKTLTLSINVKTGGEKIVSGPINGLSRIAINSDTSNTFIPSTVEELEDMGKITNRTANYLKKYFGLEIKIF